MKQEILIWRNTSTGAIREEIREQLSAHVWRSLTDGRLYTKGIIGWYDITDTNYHAEERKSIGL